MLFPFVVLLLVTRIFLINLSIFLPLSIISFLKLISSIVLLPILHNQGEVGVKAEFFKSMQHKLTIQRYVAFFFGEILRLARDEKDEFTETFLHGRGCLHRHLCPQITIRSPLLHYLIKQLHVRVAHSHLTI